jgi:hypothetical protein
MSPSSGLHNENSRDDEGAVTGALEHDQGGQYKDDGPSESGRNDSTSNRLDGEPATDDYYQLPDGLDLEDFWLLLRRFNKVHTHAPVSSDSVG